MTDAEIDATAKRIADAVYRVLQSPGSQDPDVDAHWYQHAAMLTAIAMELRAAQLPPANKPTAPLC